MAIAVNDAITATPIALVCLTFLSHPGGGYRRARWSDAFSPPGGHYASEWLGMERVAAPGDAVLPRFRLMVNKFEPMPRPGCATPISIRCTPAGRRAPGNRATHDQPNPLPKAP